MQDGHLSLADLAQHDPRARPWSPGGRALYCCPLPDCQGKKVDAAHRTLRVYPEGGWSCARCKAKGKLTDAWEDRPRPERSTQDRRAAAFVRVSTPAPKPADAPPDERRYDLAAELRTVGKIAGTLAAAYLESRGIPADVAHACGVRFAPAFGSSITYDRADGTKGNAKGAPAAVFPIRDRAGAVSGAQGRHAGEGGFWKDGPSKLTFKAEGVEEMGVFATPGAFDGPAVVVVEAPIDALTLHLCGVPSLATIGTACPAWLIERLKLRRVVLAHDADEAGDKAARAMADELAKYGASCERVRPTGAKDWNDALRRFGREALAQALAAALRLPPPPDPDPFEDPGPPVEAIGETRGAEPAEDALESPQNAGSHTEHQTSTQNAQERRADGKAGAPREWPLVGGREYGYLSLMDKWEACAAAGLPSSPKMLELLRGQWTGAMLGAGAALQAVIEGEARA